MTIKAHCSIKKSIVHIAVEIVLFGLEFAWFIDKFKFSNISCIENCRASRGFVLKVWAEKSTFSSLLYAKTILYWIWQKVVRNCGRVIIAKICRQLGCDRTFRIIILIDISPRIFILTCVIIGVDDLVLNCCQDFPFTIGASWGYVHLVFSYHKAALVICTRRKIIGGVWTYIIYRFEEKVASVQIFCRLFIKINLKVFKHVLDVDRGDLLSVKLG